MDFELDSDGDDMPLDVSPAEKSEMDSDVDDNSLSSKRNIIFNKLLPYAHLLEEEATSKLSLIKANLCKVVFYRELKPGCYYWTNQLLTYICHYGRKFSKEDHVAFIKLLYELVTIPDLEFFLVDNFAQVLMVLLQKQELLSRQDLVLQWRPLFDLYKRVAYNKWAKRNLIRIPKGTIRRKLSVGTNTGRRVVLITSSCKAVVQGLIRLSRTYFPVDSTQEMLDEWRPYLCPYSRKEINKAMEYFELFLPTVMFPEDHQNGFKLWFNEFMQIWETCHNTPSWESNIVYLVSRLADSNIGYIDWDPFIPMILTRLLRSFHLPVYMKHVRFQSTKEHYNINAVSSLLVSMLGGGSICQDHLAKLFSSLESFYHPSNNGIWNIRLQQIIAKLTAYFIKRVKRERHSSKTWEQPIPETHRLTDKDITAFVKCIKPCVMLSMFSKTGCYDAAVALKNLAILRPELIVPPILEKFYPATETLIEPHRLIAVLQCLAYVALPMVRGGKYLPEGPIHVLPVLMSCLPGIDPNDTHKTLSTFQLIACLVALVPLVDCSQMMHDYKDLTEAERELCSASAQFEDFVLQFLDRCFMIIESSLLEISLAADRVKENISNEEEQLQYLMTSVFNVILNQSSPQIREAAINKLCNFVIGRILGVKDAGYLAAKLIGATVCRVEGGLSLKRLLPTVCNVIDENVPDGGPTPANPDQELLFNMLILQELICCDGRLLLPYQDVLLKVLKKLVNVDDKDGRMIASQIMKNILSTLTTTYLLEQKNVDPSLGENDIPIRNWGATMDINKMQMPWHVSTKEELEFAQQIVDIFLTSEMSKLSDAMEGRTTMTREKLLQSVSLLHAILLGCLSRCPLWEESGSVCMETCSELRMSSYLIHNHDEGYISLNGENLREKVSKWLHNFTEYVLKSHEDNILVLQYVIKIFHHLMFFWGSEESRYQRDWKYFSGIKKILHSPLRVKRHQLRCLILHKVNFHHQVRVLGYGSYKFSNLHYEIMRDLLNFSTNHYTEVRCLAQRVLGECFISLPFSYRALLPQLEYLVDNAASFSHDKLKGLLHILLGEQHSYCLLARRDWEAALKLWPVLIKTPISDRPSVNVLLDNLVGSMNKNFETFSIYETIPESVLAAAFDLWATSDEHPFSLPGKDEIEEAALKLEKDGDKNLKNYHSLVSQQLGLLETPNLHWQSFQLGFELLTLLIRHDVKFPSSAVNLVMNSTLNDSPVVRYLAVDSLSRIMLQNKSQCSYVEVDTTDLSGPFGRLSKYDSIKVPVAAEEWDNLLFLDKPHLGFYKWPKVLRIHGSAGQQAERFKTREHMTEVDGIIYDFFTASSNLEQLIKFLSAEINKDTDKFETYRCNLFKNLAYNYGNAILPNLTPHIESLLNGTLDSQKRCGIEVVTGLIAGSKYWRFNELQVLWEALTPFLKTAWSNITVELQSDWNRSMTYITTNSDPRRLQWLHELLLSNLLVSRDGSFVEANRLLLLCVSLSEQVWKAPNVMKRILDTIQSHLAHPYQNIRDELGRLLSLVFLTNVDAPPFPNGHAGPSQKEFVSSILPKLRVFEKVMPDTSNGHPSEGAGSLAIPEDDPEWKNSVALLKTVCRWLRRRLGKSLQMLSPDIIELLPVLCQGETCDRDPELQSNCRLAIAVMGHAYLPPNMVVNVVQTMIQACNSSSWRSRKTALEYLQVLVFSNLFTLLQFPNCIDEVNKVVLKLLEDTRAEVQQVAAQVLSGLFHCNILNADDTLLSAFVTWSKTPIKKKVSDSSANGPALRKRHAGILGMSAFVRAHPYDICEGMPNILVSLGSHLHDPQPLQTTVRQVLTNFWRTHHDNWHDHKLKFTDDQLSDITDLLVSPNYYA